MSSTGITGGPHALWYSVAETWFLRRKDTRMDTMPVGQIQILTAGMVSVLVSIFNPNEVDFVDTRDFRDFNRTV
jgi:hypothetical protein